VRHRLDGLVVEAEVEHGIHHARHRSACAGAHRHQQRILRVAETLADDLAEALERRIHLALELGGIGFAVGVEISADVGGDGEARRHRQAEVRHLGKPGALTAEQIFHFRAAFRLAAAERIDPFALGRMRLRAAARGSLALRRLARRGFARWRAALRLGRRLARSGFHGHWHVDLSREKRPLSAKSILHAQPRQDA